ncbi:hypothetical protein SLEP1_g4328 [Rubroshorea leprosula]|uniref:Uncharacterized protein n=1 Tax=Rubroshorea leprosula TaxID=152421 RepID=A0AAV5HYU8_9ROSI|nr:hypothetical protein SLEP1_g4328 [Rubroshorea leprosula]
MSYDALMFAYEARHYWGRGILLGNAAALFRLWQYSPKWASVLCPGIKMKEFEDILQLQPHDLQAPFGSFIPPWSIHFACYGSFFPRASRSFNPDAYALAA